jgi:sec-independent protein translocase protein TatC
LAETSESVQEVVNFLTDRGEEIRRRIIICILIVAAASIAGYRLAPLVVKALTDGMPVVVGLVPADAFKAHLSLAVTIGIILSIPLLEWQLMRLAAPYIPLGYRRLGYFLIPASTFLFLSGVYFSYYGAYKFAMRFLLSYSSHGTVPTWSITSIVSFALALFIPSGLVFEAPIIFYFLAKAGFVKPQMLTGNWKIVLFVLFIVASVITPSPELISTSIMFVPITLMYLLSILVVKVVWKRKQRRQMESE